MVSDVVSGLSCTQRFQILIVGVNKKKDSVNGKIFRLDHTNSSARYRENVLQIPKLGSSLYSRYWAQYRNGTTTNYNIPLLGKVYSHAYGGTFPLPIKLYTRQTNYYQTYVGHLRKL